jgi:hypothetical protein
MIRLSLDRRIATYAVLTSVCLHGTFAVVGGLSEGLFGAPVPYGDSGGISFLLLGSFYELVWPIFALDIALMAIPFYLLNRPFPSGRAGFVLALLLLIAMLGCGPLLQIAWAGDATGINWVETAVDATLALIAVSLLATVVRRRTGRSG